MEDNFGDKLRFWRRKYKFSQNELALKSGVSPVTIGQIETGKRKARQKTIEKLLNGLGMTNEFFFGTSKDYTETSLTTPQAEHFDKTDLDTSAKEVVKPVILSNLDLEIINRTLNLTFEGKLTLLKYLKSIE